MKKGEFKLALPLLKKFDKTVEKSVEEEIKQRKSSFFWASLVGGFFIGIFIGLMFTWLNVAGLLLMM